MTFSPKLKKILRRIFRITITTVLIALSLVLLVLFLIQTAPVQNFGRRKLEAYLETKLKTRVRIGKLSIDFPSKVVLNEIYLEDLKKDTLLYGGHIEVDISMLKLLQHEVRVSSIELDKVSMKVNRRLPDSVYNFQFILDAFSSPAKTPAAPKDSSSGFSFSIGTIHLHDIAGLYRDDASGNDVAVHLGDFKTNLQTFDPTHQLYAIPSIELSDVSGRIRQYQPILLLKNVIDTVTQHNNNQQPVQLSLKNIIFRNIDIDYRNDATVMDASLRMGGLETVVDSLNMGNLHFGIHSISLHNTTASLTQGKQIKKAASKKNTVPAVKDSVAAQAGWQLNIAALRLDSNELVYNDENKQRLARGMDYNHLDIRQLTIHADNLRATPATYHAGIQQIAFREKAGFHLKTLSAELGYDSTSAQLKNLVIETDHSSIHNQTLIRYASVAQISKQPGELRANLLFDHASLSMQDVLNLVPGLSKQLKGNEAAVVKLNGKVDGQLKNLVIPYLEISGIGQTMLAASGSIKGLPDAKKAYYDIVIKKMTTTKTDLLKFIPASALPTSIRLPDRFAATGSFKGSTSAFNVVLHAQTERGNADIAGSLDLTHKIYDLKANTHALDLGYLLKQDSLLGRITLEATAKGNGFDPKKMNTVFQAKLVSAEIKKYNYQGLLIDGNIKAGQATIHSTMQDDNLHYTLQAEANMLPKYPSIKLDLQMDTLNLLALHLLTDTLQTHFTLHADFPSTNPDSLQGRLLLSQIALTDPKRQVSTDSILFTADRTDTSENIRLRSEMADLDLTGRYKLTQVGSALTQTISRYYKIGSGKKDTLSAEDWQLAMKLRPSPLVLAYMPLLKGTDSIQGNVFFDSREADLHLLISAPKIQYGQQIIHAVSIQAATKDSALNYQVAMQDAGRPGFQLYQTSLSGNVAHDRLNTYLLLKDKKATDRYRLGGTLTPLENGLKMVFNPDSLLLNYEAWQLPADNYIQYDSTGILVRDLKISHADESISINSKTVSATAPIDVSFANFKIKTITQFAEQDSLLMDGTINGTAEVKNVMSNPLFTSDLKISDFTYKRDTVGNLAIKVDNEQGNAFRAAIALDGHDNDLKIDGIYYTGDGKMDMNVNLAQLNLASVKTFAAAQVKDMSGYLKGQMHASGSLSQPLLKGDLHFENAVITPVITGEPLKMEKDAISFDEDGFNFAMFKFTDSAGNNATLDGNVFTKDFKAYNFDLTFNADNFRLVNAPKAPNRLFYGKLNINAAVDVTGNLDLPKINAFIRTNKNTDFVMVLPSNNPEIVDREGVVIFQDDKHHADTLLIQHMMDSIARTASLHGLDLNATIETDSSAQFTMIIDERNGDALSFRGRAELVGGIDKSGKTSLTGSYEVEDGAYSLTLSVLHRRFVIQRGSTITWTGDPTKANIDITAVYTVNTSPLDLVEQQLAGRGTDEVNKFKQRLPFQVDLKMTGELLKPIITFDVTLPTDVLALWPDVDLKLQSMRPDVAEVNKQVFALLLLGRFVGENPFESAAGGTSTEAIARQSASKILSDQLNQLAGSLIKGVDINIDLNSDQNYSTSGSMLNQTSLNVGVSKNLFSDRIRVTVGNNFELEQTNPNQSASNIAGDVSVDYRLSKDGRYMLRAYRKDQYESIVEGQVVETGLSFILTFDYNSFSELFHNRKDPKKTIRQKKKPSSNGNNQATQ